jgi:2-dehydro-3-deoxygluconokinase
MIATLGEALVVAAPDGAVPLAEAAELRLLVGGSEVNFAIGVRRLGLEAAWIGRLGDDPMGRRILDSLAREGVHTRWVSVDPKRPTGLYLREWLADGRRRAYYYRTGSAATALTAADVPAAAVRQARWLHVTGITVALGAGPRAAVMKSIDHARRFGVPVSFDPNYRPALWRDRDARSELHEIAERSDVLLLSAEEAELVFDTTDARTILDRRSGSRTQVVVVKHGDEGATAADQGHDVVAAPLDLGEAVDPVGAGDGFDAGFVVARLAGADLAQAVDVGNYVGACAVRELGEHAYPNLQELPSALRAAVTSPSRPRAKARQPAR